jgi:hypothetical protein
MSLYAALMRTSPVPHRPLTPPRDQIGRSFQWRSVMLDLVFVGLAVLVFALAAAAVSACARL